MSLRSRGVHRCAQVCTGVCVGGGWGQRAESRVGSCQKIRLPSTRHIEGSCVCPGHVFTLFALPGAGFVAETSELVTPPGPPGQGSLRLMPVTGFLPLLTCPARAPFPDSQSGSKDKYTHSRAPVLTCSCMSAAGQAGGVGKASRADSQTAPAWRAMSLHSGPRPPWRWYPLCAPAPCGADLHGEAGGSVCCVQTAGAGKAETVPEE